MTKNVRRLALYAALGMTALMLLFPPFAVNGGLTEYGFIFSRPPSARQAIAAASMMGGAQGEAMARDMVQYSIDILRLAIQICVVWAIFIALRRTVLKSVAVSVDSRS